ncbi:glycosyltransferase family 2 protein [Acidaminococcus fermentans]|uniref:glycosyltransferase family 2 protein n=1 Tax=Acidaminococcus fermentans TaxID=905 RepID=UPI003F8C1C89
MISVIVPVYNSSQFLDQCIMSILNQSYSDIELILVDDSSTDESFRICHKYAAKDRRIKVLSNVENKGQVYSYVKGIKEAKGDFISFVDSDDWISPDMLEKLYMALCDYDADISACGCWHIYDNHKIVEPANIHEIGRKLLSHQELLKSAESVHVPGNYIDTIVKLYRCNKIFKKIFYYRILNFYNMTFEYLKIIIW